MIKCPECGANLRKEALWQGRLVTCTSCGALLENTRLSAYLSPAAGLIAGFFVLWLLDGLGLHFALEVIATLLALTGVYVFVHGLTARIGPREEEPTLKL